MYKNLHASYLQITDEISEDVEVNSSIIKEFEMFGDDVGMFDCQEPEVNEELGKKYYANVGKTYVFEEMEEHKDKNNTNDEKEKKTYNSSYRQHRHYKGK